MKSKYSIRTQILNSIRKFFTNNFIERILAKIAQGKEPDSLIAKLLPSHYLYKSGSIRIVNRFSLNFKLDISELVDWHLYFGLKDKSYNKLFSICRSEYKVLDVGANNGALLLRLSKLAHNGFVYGFEPDPINFRRCMLNVSMNNPKNVRVFNIGLGREEGTAFLSVVDPANLGMNKIFFSQSDPNSNRVGITTIDKFVQINSIKKIDLIKIDTEGFELEILKGAVETLKKWQPKLFIEVDDNNLKENQQSAMELIKYITEFGYKIVRADNGMTLDLTKNLSNCHFDIFAIVV